MVIVIIITIDLHVCTSALARGNTSYCGLIYSSSEGSFHSDAYKNTQLDILILLVRQSNYKMCEVSSPNFSILSICSKI